MIDNRPLSPHLSIHKKILTAVFSIFHRITGIALSIGSVLIAIWIFLIAMGPQYFLFFEILAESIVFKIILLFLKEKKRPEIVAAIAEARSHGDLKENAEYHAAKEEQAKIEGRILEINDVIARANVIDVTQLEKKDNVIFGSTVYLVNLESSEKKVYKIVGKDEADIAKNYIYFRSPIGKALIGKKKKELVKKLEYLQ